MKYLKIYLCIVLTLLVSSAFINAQTNPQDSAARVAIYRHAHGDSWTNNTNWLTGPVDTWYGVTVSSQRVVGLDLSSDTLSGILHDSVSLLTALNTLILKNNQLSGVLPDNPLLSFQAPSVITVMRTQISGDSLYLVSVADQTGTSVITVTAGDGFSSVTDSFRVTVHPDAQPPVISDVQTPDTVNQAVALPVSCVVNDNLLVQRVVLHYRAGAGPEDTVAMTLNAGRYAASVPAARVTAFKIFYSDVDPVEQYICEHHQSKPARFALRQNYPNPFNPGTHLRFELPVDAKVTGIIYNALGQEIITLMHQKYFTAGVHELFWNGKDRNNRTVASDIYIYRINV